MDNHYPDKRNKLDPGGTQREIIKCIILNGGECNEPKIRECLRDSLNITAISGIKIHLDKLLSNGILLKEEGRGRSNIWRLNYENKHPVAYYLLRNFLNLEYSATSLEEVITGINASWEFFKSEGVQKFISTNSFLDEFFILMIGRINIDAFGKNTLEYNLNISKDKSDFLETILTDSVGASLLLFKALFYPFVEQMPMFSSLMHSKTLNEIEPGDLLFVTFCMVILCAVFVELVRHHDDIDSRVSLILKKIQENHPDHFSILFKILKELDTSEKEKLFLERLKSEIEFVND